MRQIWLTTIIVLCSIAVNAQEITQNIRGTVVDRESEAPLIGATVQLLNTTPPKGVSTDIDGHFILENVSIGRHQLKISYLGYEDVVLPNVLVGSAKEVILRIPLQESYIQMEEVVISAENPKERANNEMATVSARSFSTDETSRFAASVDDPARMALSFAGVSTSNDLSNEIIIRGNSPLGMLWRMNGIEIPSPNHFSEQGASSGGISALSVNMLDNSDFFTGAFPAEYGNATSGVFDVKLRNGNNQQREYVMQVGLLGTDVALEGPIKKGYSGSYLFNYRYSTLTILNDMGVIDTEGEDNIFQDLAFQLNLPTEKNGIFKIFGLGGLSSATGDANRDSVKANPEEEYDDSEFISNFGIIGLDHKYFISNRTYLQTSISASRQKIGYQEDLINPFTLATNRDYEDEYINDAIRYATTVNHKFNNKHTLRSGYILSHLKYKLFGEGADDDDVYRKFLDADGAANTIQTFGQWKYRFAEKWTINSGLHIFYLGMNRNYSVEPRLGLQYQINEIQSLSFGFGLHSRMAPLSVYNSTTIDDQGNSGRANQDLDLSKARHYVIGYDRQLAEQLHMKVEVYYQDLFNVWVYDDPNTSYSAVNSSAGYSTRVLSDEGTATNYGVELTLEKFFSNNYYYMLTSSIFESLYQMPDGREFQSRFNKGYNFSLLGGKEFPMGKDDKNLLGLNLRLLYGGGNRYKPIDLESSEQADKTIRYEDQGFSKIGPDYYRFDLTTEYRINKPKLAHIISLQVQNFTNHLNVFTYYYDDKKDKIQEETQFGLIPVLKYRVEF